MPHVAVLSSICIGTVAASKGIDVEFLFDGKKWEDAFICM
jgi:hypothetical protein